MKACLKRGSPFHNTGRRRETWALQGHVSRLNKERTCEIAIIARKCRTEPAETGLRCGVAWRRDEHGALSRDSEARGLGTGRPAGDVSGRVRYARS